MRGCCILITTHNGSSPVLRQSFREPSSSWGPCGISTHKPHSYQAHFPQGSTEQVKNYCTHFQSTSRMTANIVCSCSNFVWHITDGLLFFANSTAALDWFVVACKIYMDLHLPWEATFFVRCSTLHIFHHLFGVGKERHGAGRLKGLTKPPPMLTYKKHNVQYFCLINQRLAGRPSTSVACDILPFLMQRRSKGDLLRISSLGTVGTSSWDLRVQHGAWYTHGVNCEYAQNIRN